MVAVVFNVLIQGFVRQDPPFRLDLADIFLLLFKLLDRPIVCDCFLVIMELFFHVPIIQGPGQVLCLSV